MPRVHQPVVHPFDREHGTDTSGLIPGTTIAPGTSLSADELTAYYGIAPSILHGLLDTWLRTKPAAIERSVFLDVGAGKGRAMLLASTYPFLRVEGIELNAGLCQITRRNMRLFADSPAALAPMSLRRGDATRAQLPPGPTLAFLFHPFELPVLRRFVLHVERSLRRNPRPFDLIYANAEHDSLLDHDPRIHRLWHGRVAMSTEDHIADLAEIATQKEYGSTGDELCSIYRFR